jgi:hypothetical protein
MNPKVVLVLAALLVGSYAQAQKTIRGFVIDSASFAPLPYVNVVIKNSYRGVSTDDKGGFAISTHRGDSLIFSLVGYNELVFSAGELEETVIIRMAEHVKLLQAVTIIGKKEKVVPPFHIAPNERLPNYGPYGKGLDLSYFGKRAKEQRKLHVVKAEHERVKTYVMVVASPEVRERICKEFEISEEQYYSILLQFNIDHNNVNEVMSSEEWVTVLRRYYAASLKK